MLPVFSHVISMKFLLILIFFTISHSNLFCESKDSMQTESSLNSAKNEIERINSVLNNTEHDNFTYIGLSPKMQSPKKEIQQAKIHIANQIAMNIKCKIDVGFISFYTENSFKSNKDSFIDYFDADTKFIVDNIEISSIYYFSNLTVVIGKYKNKATECVLKITRNFGERPHWISDIPKIDGFYVGVGMSAKYSVPYKSMLVADVDAAQQISIEKNAFIASFYYENITNSSSKILNSEKISGADLTLSQSELYGFYVIDRWIEPDGSTFYSLAIAKRK